VVVRLVLLIKMRYHRWSRRDPETENERFRRMAAVERKTAMIVLEK
jgi:hypothetical protein